MYLNADAIIQTANSEFLIDYGYQDMPTYGFVSGFVPSLITNLVCLDLDF